MLVRCARRNAQARTYQALRACEKLELPWLCPAYQQLRKAPGRFATTEAGSPGYSPRKRRNSKDGMSTSTTRSLATAIEYRPIDEIPFEGLGQSQMPSYRNSPHTNEISLANIRPWDPSSPVVLDDSLNSKPALIRLYGGVGGHLNEILSVLEACLQVGRMERAGVIIRRIAAIRALDPKELLRLHNRYLKISLENIKERSTKSAQTLHKWFEMEIKNKDVQMDAETIVYMLKASFHSPSGSRRDRLLQRYLDLLHDEATAEFQVLANSLLTPKELASVTDLTSFNLSVDRKSQGEDSIDYNLDLDDDKNETVSTQKAIPEVLSVSQKGLGLKALKQSLSLFEDKPADFSSDSLQENERRERQSQLEQDSVRSAVDRWREESIALTKKGVDTSLQTKSLGARMWRWHGALQHFLEGELLKIDEAEAKTTRSTADHERTMYGPFLRLLPLEKLAAVTILSCMSNLSVAGVNKGLTLSQAIMVIGSSVEEESITEFIRSNYSKQVWDQLTGGNAAGLARRLRNRQARLDIASSLQNIMSGRKSGEIVGQDLNMDPQWSTGIKAKVGAFLMSALLETAKVPVTREHPESREEVTQMQPAFSHAYQYKLGKKIGVILANPALIESLRREPVHSLLAKHLPMVAEPEPWSSFNEGGFMVHPAKMMRIKLGDKDQRNYAEAAIARGDMEQMFKGLDVLGKTAWKINQSVFDIMLEAWNGGEEIANFPTANPNLELPPEPDSSTDPTERRRWLHAVKNIENRRSGYHSQRCFQNFQLEIARSFRDETFYFPHNVDFRGRAYPIPPYLNHMGADHCRGLLRFAKGRELGENGLRWLKIHLANVYGYDKASLHEREAFADEHVEDVFDSANSPLTGRRWWLDAGDPWQCLAACFELKHALDSPDPAQFISHLPIHQDGTCNGLQHYAALGGDEFGARQVNLEPSDRPADVYSAVANMVKESLELDLKKGHPYAKALEGKITRKVVKQTVMTNVYGVTFIGARAQVRKQLLAAHSDLPDTPDMNPAQLSSYVAGKIFEALSKMFKGAHDIQYWLGECASRISVAVSPEQVDRIIHLLDLKKSSVSSKESKSIRNSIDENLQFKSSVIWTNPLRMPVVQPYRQSKSRTILTNLQRINISEPHRSDPVSKRKQLQGFPPNFIHSLDATHMILSALRCDELNLSFAAVHDSFWTHAADVEVMNGVLRDAFVRIHTEDVIGRLAAEFKARYKGSLYLAKIRPGSHLSKRIAEVRKASRQVSPKGAASDGKAGKKLRIRELLAERTRMRLLDSTDPDEVEEGRQMVTPGSIFEEMAADADLARSEDLAALGLGDMPSHGTARDELENLENHQPGEIATDRDLSIEADEDVLPDGECEDPSPMPKKNPFADKVVAKSAKSAKRNSRQNWQLVWLPLTFPKVPKKGSFDVSRLKDSQYFFS